MNVPIIPGDVRKPIAGFANYPPGIDTPNPVQPMGPSRLGELLWPVTVERTAERTRVGFAYTQPDLEGIVTEQLNARWTK